jgi:hypothetical protein
MVSRNMSQTTTRRHFPVSFPALVSPGIMLTVVGVTTTAHAVDHAHLGQALGVADTEILHPRSL